MSELEQIANEIRGLANDSNAAEQLVAEMAREIDRFAGRILAMGHLRHLGGLSSALDSLTDSYAKTRNTSAHLQSVKQGAAAFADSLVGGSSSARVSSGEHWVSGAEGVQLKPNASYQAGEFNYEYKTDGVGRIVRFSASDLHLTDRDRRLPHDGATPGKLGEDHAGHLAGDRFGGSPHIDNLVSQHGRLVNLSKYKRLENDWALELQKIPPSRVRVDIRISYGTDGSMRPTKFLVRYWINGAPYQEAIKNPDRL